MILRLAASLLLDRHRDAWRVPGSRDVDDLPLQQLGILLGQELYLTFILFNLVRTSSGLQAEFVAAEILFLLRFRRHIFILLHLLFGVPMILSFFLLQGEAEVRRQLLEELSHLIVRLRQLGNCRLHLSKMVGVLDLWNGLS